MTGVLLYIGLLVAAVFIALRMRQSAENGSRQAVMNRICLAALFFLLFIPSALRIYTGNDYLTYIVRFHNVYRKVYFVTEPGFNAVVNAVYGFLNEEYYLVIFAVFAAFTVFFFLRAIYEQSRDIALSVFLYMALGLYFQSYNTVRYYLALGIVLYSVRSLLEKQYIKFILLILLAALFHKTALAVLLIYAVAVLPWKKWMVFPAGTVCISGLLLKEQYLALLLKLYPSYVNEPEYLNSGQLSIINILRCAACIALYGWMIFLRRKEKKLTEEKDLLFYLKLNVLALLAYVFFSFVPFLSRIGYYMSATQIMLIPALLQMAPQSWQKYLKSLVWVAGAVFFSLFLYKAFGDTVHILPYHTWMLETENFKAYELLRFAE